MRRGLETEREGVLNPEGALAPQVASAGPSSTEGEAVGPELGVPDGVEEGLALWTAAGQPPPLLSMLCLTLGLSGLFKDSQVVY